MKAFRAIAAAAFLLGQGFSTSADDAAAIAPAQAAAKGWLALTDSGKYGESWDGAASYFKAVVSKPDWEKTLTGVRSPQGAIKARKVKSATFTRSLPGAPDGEYVVIQFESQFENMAAAIETVTPMHEKDGTWRVSGYFIRPSAADLPGIPGWMLAGDKPADYSVSIDPAAHGGKKCARLSSVASLPTGFGTLMQMFNASQYRGKRLRMTGFVKTLDVTGWAGLWMRVDGTDWKMLAFDNMADRPIKGTTEWRSYSVTLDVGDAAQAIAFGLLLGGGGSAFVDDFSFEVVRSDAPTTGSAHPASPRNLDFEQ